MERPKRKSVPETLEKIKNYELLIVSDTDFYGLRDIVWDIVAPDAEKLEGYTLQLSEKQVFIEFVQPIIESYADDSGIDSRLFSSIYIGWDYDWFFGKTVSLQTRNKNLQHLSNFFMHLDYQVKQRGSNLN